MLAIALALGLLFAWFFALWHGLLDMFYQFILRFFRLLLGHFASLMRVGGDYDNVDERWSASSRR